LLGLLSERDVLTTGQLVRLTWLPERTVQHRLGQLHRAGLVNRCRPEVPVGTAPSHAWLTGVGAAAIGAGPPEPWSEDRASVQAMAALSDMWLGVRDRGSEIGLHLVGWRRLRDGLTWRDPGSDAVRQLPIDAELRVTLIGEVAPEPGALRPLARALLAVASEVHAALRDLPGDDHRPSERALRMGNRGLLLGIHSGVRSVVLSPATLERPGSEDASSQVKGTAPPPVVNPDAMGDCA